MTLSYLSPLDCVIDTVLCTQQRARCSNLRAVHNLKLLYPGAKRLCIVAVVMLIAT